MTSHRELSKYLNEDVISLLREEIERGRFPGVTFEHAMQFFLTDGILPVSGAPAQSYLDLEDWLRTQQGAK